MIAKTITKQVYLKKLEETLNEWRSFGAVSTPREIVEQMIELADLKKQKDLDILEPACGFCNFLIGIYLKYPKNNFYGVEINDEVYKKIKELFKDTPFKLIKTDFLLWKTAKKFDLIIGNPPYGIIGDGSHYPIHILKRRKEEYKKIFNTWFGKYNIYGAFIEKSVNLLKPNGKLVFIIPATWMILDEFSKLRKFLSYLGRVKVYYLGNNVFKGVSVSVCILVFEKGKQGAELFLKNDKKFLNLSTLNSWNGDILKFETEFTRRLERDKVLLNSVFEIKISARSPEVKNFSKVLQKPKNDALPLMNGRNVKRGFIDRNNYTNLWLEKREVPKLKTFYGILPRIVVGHTKGGKIVAAVENELYPYVGDVYHLLPKFKFTKQELEKIVEWLNSEDIENYATTLYKEITPHITATQLKNIPLNIDKNMLKNKEKTFQRLLFI